MSHFLPFSLPCILACVSFTLFPIFTYLSPHFLPADILPLFFHFSSPILAVHFPSALLILCTSSPCFSSAGTHLFVYAEVSLPQHVPLPSTALCPVFPTWPIILKLALSNILNLENQWRSFPKPIHIYSLYTVVQAITRVFLSFCTYPRCIRVMPPCTQYLVLDRELFWDALSRLHAQLFNQIPIALLTLFLNYHFLCFQRMERERKRKWMERYKIHFFLFSLHLEPSASFCLAPGSDHAAGSCIW